MTYSWTITGGTITWVGAPTYETTWTAGTGTSATLNVTVTDTVTGCYCNTSEIVTITPRPTADAGFNVAFCEGGSAVIGGSPTGSGGTGTLYYSWTPTAGLDDPSIANPTASPVSITTYTVEVTDDNGCTNSDDVDVTVNANPVAYAGLDDSFCEDDSVALSGSASGGTLPYTYDWTGPETHLSNQTPIVSRHAVVHL